MYLWYNHNNLYITKRLFNAFRISGVTFEVSNCTKFQMFRGSPPRTPLGELSAPPDPKAGGEGARCPVPKNPIPALEPSGLGLRKLRPLPVTYAPSRYDTIR